LTPVRWLVHQERRQDAADQRRWDGRKERWPAGPTEARWAERSVAAAAEPQRAVQQPALLREAPLAGQRRTYGLAAQLRAEAAREEPRRSASMTARGRSPSLSAELALARAAEAAVVQPLLARWE
jgi:hypothetical protein